KLAVISSAGKVANSATTATSSNISNAIVARDAAGNFSAEIITATLNGNATTANTTNNFLGSLSGDVMGTQGATIINLVGGQTAANVASATIVINNATNSNIANTVVKRDSSGNFTAGTITASLNGNATTATTATTATSASTATTAATATNFSGSLSGEVTGTQSATVVSTVGGQSAANVTSAATEASKEA